MPDLKWKELFKALFLSICIGYICVGLIGKLWSERAALLIGFGIFMSFGWLFYEFRRKIRILKRVFVEQLLDIIKKEGGVIYDDLWKKNEVKISCVISSIITALFFVLSYPWALEISTEKEGFWFGWGIIGCLVAVVVWILLSSLRDVNAEGGLNRLTDKEVAEFVFWKLLSAVIYRIPKFFLKVLIVGIYKAHSWESVIVSFYALFGMLYVIIFPPFKMVLEMMFLMAIGGGIFGGVLGCLIHKVLLMSLPQKVFVKVESWSW